MRFYIFKDKLTGTELDAKGRDVHEARLSLKWPHELGRYTVYKISDCVAGARYLINR